MKRLRYFLFIILSVAVSGCTKQQAGACENEVDARCSCPPMVKIVPCNTFSVAEAQQIRDHLQAFRQRYFAQDSDTFITIAEPVQLDKTLMNKGATRFSAPKILNLLQKNRDSNEIVIALLHNDISTNKNSRDWGVLGLSYRGRCVSVASTYRVKEKAEFWKVVAHELIHAYCNYGHCPDDNPACIMKDAKGHPNLKKQHGLCETCQKNLLK